LQREFGWLAEAVKALALAEQLDQIDSLPRALRHELAMPPLSAGAVEPEPEPGEPEPEPEPAQLIAEGVPPDPAAAAAADHNAAVSLFEQLKQAKQMLDADLISAADYDRVKQKLLAKLEAGV
jgi:hypothetical protein